MQARRPFDTGVDAGRNDAAPERAEPGDRGVTTVCTPRTARSLAAVFLVAFAAILLVPLQAEAQTGICSRTDRIVVQLMGATGHNPFQHTCADVTDAHLAAVTELTLRAIDSLAVGDLDGLTALTTLFLENNSLTSLPSGVFDELTALTYLVLGGNSLTELDDDVFDELTALAQCKTTASWH